MDTTLQLSAIAQRPEYEERLREGEELLTKIDRQMAYHLQETIACMKKSKRIMVPDDQINTAKL